MSVRPVRKGWQPCLLTPQEAIHSEVVKQLDVNQPVLNSLYLCAAVLSVAEGVLVGLWVESQPFRGLQVNWQPVFGGLAIGVCVLFVFVCLSIKYFYVEARALADEVGALPLPDVPAGHEAAIQLAQPFLLSGALDVVALPGPPR